MKSIQLKRLAAFALLLPLLASCARIDAGHVGLVVNLYGSKRGVQDVAEVTGFVWYNPMTTRIYEFPTFVQNVVFTDGRNEGSTSQEGFRVTTKDGLSVAFDISLNYRVDPGQVSKIFVKYRKPLHELDRTIMRNFLRDAYNEVSGRYTAEQLYENKNKFMEEAEKQISNRLGREGFIVEQVVLLNELRLPKSVMANIDAKINARQIALKKEQEVAQERAEAQKSIEQAKGAAESIRIRAEAEANANRVVAESISPNLIEYEKVKKWDGKNPQYVGTGTGGAVFFKGQ
ncbi:SPFH domain-containing protein [Eisenibacter elegans]|uniref:SPFH domain-containing protein n=1 Tax=Eisenibacter elegans TaxID=997 RepID=UPI00047EF38D|nr:SPFH domain-containing protein [Eisenibacter elegans]